MQVEVTAVTKQIIDISPEEAFRVLCKTLDMECVLNEYSQYQIRTDEDGSKYVYIGTKNSEIMRIDDRGELFIALRNVAVQMFPNCEFRGEDYIYNY